MSYKQLFILLLCLALVLKANYPFEKECDARNTSFLSFYKYSDNQNGVRKYIDDDKFVKSKIDRAKYRYLKLDNGLKVYLVSKDNIVNSEVAISIGVGFLHDPIYIQGLSNLVQHSLLLASKQYPDVDEFKNFINTLNGKIYLDLHSKMTIYSFSIGTEYLNESLFRFSSYFINPILSRDNVNKALVTIFNIIEGMKTNEKWVMRTIEREVCGSSSNFNRYIFGNKNIFLNNPNLNAGELYDRVLDYFNNYYSPNIMTLSIVGREPIDKLEKYVIKSFGNIKNNGIELFRIEDSYKFTVNPFISVSGKIITVKRPNKKDVNTFTIRIPIEFQIIYWKRIPTLYVKYLLDSSYKGILRKYFTKIGVNSEIKVSTTSFDGFSTLDITVNLYNRELNRSWEVIGAVASALRFIIESPVKKRLLNEIKDITDLLFDYRESDFYKDIAYNIVYKSQKYKIKPEEVIFADEVIKVLDVEFTESFLNSIDISSMVIFYSTPRLVKKRALDERSKVLKRKKYIRFRSSIIRIEEDSSSLVSLFLRIYDSIKEYVVFVYSLMFRELKLEERESRSEYLNSNYLDDAGFTNYTGNFVQCNSILRSRYLNSEYCVNEIPDSFKSEIQNMTISDIKEVYFLDIDTPNKYIPQDLSFQEIDESTQVIPQPLLFSIKRHVRKSMTRDNSYLRRYEYYPEIFNFYYKNSELRSVPEASLSIRIQTPVIDSELNKVVPGILKIVPRLMVSVEILCSSLLVALEDEINSFRLTRNEFKILSYNSYFYNGLPNGFTVVLSGYWDVIPTFLRIFADFLRNPKERISHSDFEKGYENVHKLLYRTVFSSSSLTRSLEIIRAITENQQLSPIERFREIENVSYTDIVELSEFLAKHGQLEGIFMNNINPILAGDILNEFVELLRENQTNRKDDMVALNVLENGKVFIENKQEIIRKLKLKSKPYSVHNILAPISSSEKIYFNTYEILDITSLPDKAWKSYRFEYSNNEDDKSVVSLLLGVGTKTPFTIALATLTNIFLSDLMSMFLKKLSIENETARSFSPAYYSSLMFIVIQIDSYSKDVTYLTEFLIGFLDEVFKNPYLIDKNDFYIIKRGCIDKFKRLNNNIELFNNLFFTFIEGSSYPFVWVKKVIQIFETLTFARFLKLFKLLHKTPQIIVSIQSKVSQKYKIDKYLPNGYTLLNSTDDLLNQENLYIYKLPINVSPNIFSEDW
ncbi:secreted insulinase like peptidase [Cryptosporidium ryanae]|uniref:secreted insulinase like peptidase n=1 Tax=Cryptosporidium ryanae TaxID=515981 RepID=UPI00351A248C|nr:secreted insulinase like peptidase [Cryptosporidium ryanae]